MYKNYFIQQNGSAEHFLNAYKWCKFDFAHGQLGSSCALAACCGGLFRSFYQCFITKMATTYSTQLLAKNSTKSFSKGALDKQVS